MHIIPFSADATLPAGSTLAYDDCTGVTNPLLLRGVVIDTGDQPAVVLASLDWIAVGGSLYDLALDRLAEAAGTSADRISLHCVHQHDAPWGHHELAEAQRAHGLTCRFADRGEFAPILDAACRSIAMGRANPLSISHVGVGQGLVSQVASTRRPLGEDGKVKFVRYSSCKDPAGRAEPEGLIDPWLKLISFWQDDTPQLAMAYYACHPQSYYHTGKADCDFPGLARQLADTEHGLPHLYFTGAAGNVTAGKWNDGSRASRHKLVQQLAAGYRAAWADTTRRPVAQMPLAWKQAIARLPMGPHMDRAVHDARLADPSLSPADRASALRKRLIIDTLGDPFAATFSRLSLGDDVHVVHGPAELFVEYQLYAQSLRPSQFVAMAAYGRGELGYIPTAIAFDQGGYEPSDRATHTSPACQPILEAALRDLLND